MKDREKQIVDIGGCLLYNPYVSMSCDKVGILAQYLYNEGCRKQSGWVSVKERLPTYEDGKVLIYTAYGISIAERTTSNRWRGDCAIPKLITHWMPLPEAPKGGEE
jgi:hypothetical protein